MPWRSTRERPIKSWLMRDVKAWYNAGPVDKGSPCCKHELAVLLARPLGKELCREMEDAEWATKFSHALTHPMITYDPKVAATGDALPSRPALMP